MSEENKILIIDDEKNIRMTLEKTLTGAGYEVETAFNGEEGIQKLKEDNYPVILLDMKLPGMNGIDVLKKIKDLDYHSKVIMITGYGTIDTAVETMKLGAVDYLRKPFKPEEILDLVDKVFDRYQLEEKEEGNNFEEYLNRAKSAINKRNFDDAVELLKKATSIDAEKPEPFNLLGIIYEFRRNQPQAMKMYRTALSLDPSYKPASENLQRAGEMDITQNSDIDDVNLGDDDK
ncbi:MAG: response regulator [Halanaerobiales bacterium]